MKKPLTTEIIMGGLMRTCIPRAYEGTTSVSPSTTGPRVVREKLIEPYLLPAPLNEQSYLAFLKIDFETLWVNMIM